MKRERLQFPLTVVFGNLETISSCYAFFNNCMGNDQYEPLGAVQKAENRLFSQFHAQYPLREKERIVNAQSLGTSKLRIIFATVAFGVGIDLKNIRHLSIWVSHAQWRSTFRRQVEQEGMASHQVHTCSIILMIFQKQKKTCLQL